MFNLGNKSLDVMQRKIYTFQTSRPPHLALRLAEALGTDSTLAMLLPVGTTTRLLLTVGKIVKLLKETVLGTVLVGLLRLLGGGGGGVLVEVELRLVSELVVGMILTLLDVACVGCCCCDVLVLSGRCDCCVVLVVAD